MVDICAFHTEQTRRLAVPRYESWADFVARTTGTEIRKMCHARTKKANAERLFSPAPERRLSAVDVWHIMASARGRCVHCGSLCVERTPYAGTVKLPWEHVGRRIGTVEHLKSRVDGGGNEPANLAWACLWCNDYGCERTRGATDHGGLFPPDDGERDEVPPPWSVRTRAEDESDEEHSFIEEDDPFGRDWL